MRQRTALVGAAIVAALVVSAGVPAVLGSAGASGQPQAQEPVQAQEPAQAQLSDTVTVSGSGQIEAQADQAVVDVVVLATGDDITGVREQLATNASRMRDALTESGIDESQIRTEHYDISSRERYRVPRGEEDAPKYRAVHAFTVTVEEPDRAGEIIDTAVNNGASEVGGVDYTLSSDKRQRLRQQALDAAMSAARTEASTIASAEGLQIVDVDRASTVRNGRSPRPVALAATPAPGDAGTSISSGPVTVSAQVTVVYEVDG